MDILVASHVAVQKRTRSLTKEAIDCIPLRRRANNAERRCKTMAERIMALVEYLRKLGLKSNCDFLRESVRLTSQLLMEAVAEERVGAAKHERSPRRRTQRNGYRERMWETPWERCPLRIPKLRSGSHFPSLLEPRRKAEQALLKVVQEAYVQGVSTRSGRPGAVAGAHRRRQEPGQPHLQRARPARRLAIRMHMPFYTA